ncbi:hypothetical protein V5799_021277 [Amblyomma americanum]|uniref:CIDE-N domain-containing protein n=1 Tax=Amblyomma americanum TaxID=6943 RepID=A0AAQ4FNR8_AMBAM
MSFTRLVSDIAALQLLRPIIVSSAEPVRTALAFAGRTFNIFRMETTSTPFVKIWSVDHRIKKMACATSLKEVKEQACQKGVCTSVNAKVFLTDGSELEESMFEELVNELPPQERIFVVGAAAPSTEPGLRVTDRHGVRETDCPTTAQHHDSCTFVLDTKYLSKSLQEHLDADTLPLPLQGRRELVRVAVEQMMKWTCHPRRDFTRKVAKDLVKKFPGSLKDVALDGQVLGNGYNLLFQQIENRVENLRRGQSGSLPKNGGLEIRKSCSYGCQNGQHLLEAETTETLGAEIDFLKTEGQKALRDIDVPRAMRCMDRTYALQRKFINSHKSSLLMSQVKEQWPLLFHRPFFYKHCDSLLGKDVQATFRANVCSYAPLLMKSLEKSSSRDIKYLLIEAQYASKKNEAACEAALMPLLAAYFKDCSSTLYHVFEEGTDITSQLPELPSTPVVVAVGGIHRQQCYVYCQQEVLIASPTDFSEATCLMFLAHCVFNVKHASAAATTMEFLQRQIFELNHIRDRKRRGGRWSRTSVHSKVLKLEQMLRTTAHAE